MEEIEFGANGVRLAELDDYQTIRETARNDLRACVPLLLGLSGALGALAYITTSTPDGSFRTLLEAGALFTVAACMAAAMMTFRIIAQEDGLIPASTNKTAPPDHITGLGAALAIGLALFISLAAILGQLLYPRFEIPEIAGFGVMIFMGTTFLVLTLTPHVSDALGSGDLLSRLRFLTAWLAPVGRILSTLDSWLVHLVAPSVGAMLLSWPARYGCLLSHVAIGTSFTWFCPSPFGFLGAVWAVLAIVSVARRWSWIETERQRLNKSPSMPRSQLKVSVDQDLRDEAIWGLLLLMIILPITMRQFYLTAMEPDAFKFDGGVKDDPVAWMGFFGVELVKALPFVDWADIYGAQGSTRIHVNSAIAMHAVFTARVLIDVLFISALLQAVSISVSLARHKREFLQGLVNVLDDRIERTEFMRLAKRRSGVWIFRPEIAHFKHYDQTRLRSLKLTARLQHPRVAAAVERVCQLADLEVEPPSEQLMEEANSRRPKRAAMEAAMRLVLAERDFDLGNLATTRRFLNWKRGVEGVRQQVIQLLITQVPASRDRDVELLQILHGPDCDSLLAIRIMVIDPLARNARQNPEVLSTLQQVAANDRSDAVKRKAMAALNSLGLPPLAKAPTAISKRKAS